MTTAYGVGKIPQFDQSDRLRKAREFAGLDQQELADRIGVSRKTVSSAERGVTKPRQILLNQWSLVTGVPKAWIENGESPRPDGDPNGGSAECAARDSNPEPAGLEDRPNRTRWADLRQVA